MKAKFEEIVDIDKVGNIYAGVDLEKVMLMADNEVKVPARNDYERVELFIIDGQSDFISALGSLPVFGAINDTIRLCKFIYRFIEQISGIRETMDWHSACQIFFPSAWVYGKDFTDENGVHKVGEHVLPNVTVITSKGIKEGKFVTTLPDTKKAYEYVERIDKAKASNNSVDELRIWPYHCEKNTWGATIEGELNKIIMYHKIIRDTDVAIYYKGQDVYSEQYGAVEAEYSPENEVRHDILSVFEDSRTVRFYFAGQAKSHCVLRTLCQIAKHYANRPDILDKFWVLEDCMSCIPGFESATEEKMNELKKMGIHFIKSTDVVDIRK